MATRVGQVSERAEAGVRAAVVGVLLLVLGVLCWLASRLASGTENHAYSSSAVAPNSVHVTSGRTYELSYPGGVAALAGQGIDPGSLVCDWSLRGGVRQSLPLVVEGTNTLRRNVVGEFTADTTGDIHIACNGLGAMFVDDADHAPGDPSGWLLLLATVALVLGVPLALSGLRSARRASRTAGEDDDIERLVGIVRGRATDIEVRDADGDDVPE